MDKLAANEKTLELLESYKLPCEVGDVIHFFQGGSHLFGTELPDTSDTDLYGVFIEPPVRSLGLNHVSHFVYPPSDGRVAMEANEVEVKLYSLRRWIQLILEGNERAVHFLFAPTCLPGYPPWYNTVIWEEVCDFKHVLLSRENIQGTLKYTQSHRKHIAKTQGISSEGYDTKYAMHVIRALQMALELMNTGEITFPRPNAEELRAIRKGRLSYSSFVIYAEQLTEDIENSLAKSVLYEKVDRDKVSRLLTQWYQQHWRTRQ